MSNIEKIKEVLDVQYTKDAGYVTLRFKSGLETKRKFNLVVLQYPKKCALIGTDLGIGKQVIYFNIKRQGYGRYYLDPVNVQKARDEHLDIDQEQEGFVKHLIEFMDELRYDIKQMEDESKDLREALRAVKIKRSETGKKMSKCYELLELLK